MTFGQLVSWILGYFLSWRTTAYVLMAPPLLLILLFLPFPESPYWLVEKSKLKLAKKSLEFYRGNQYNVAEELFEISQSHESKLKNALNTGYLILTEQEETKTRYLAPLTDFKQFFCYIVLIASVKF